MHLHYKILIIAILGMVSAVSLRGQCDLSASSSGANAAYTQVYVLVNAATGNIVAQNSTGSFLSVAPGVYRIHALNYDPANPPAPLPSDLVGQAIALVGTSNAGCYNSDFLTDYVNRACAACLQNRSICETDPLVVSTSGENAAYTQLYVLVDAATGLVLATNTSGVFTGQVSAGNSYQIYALNYDPGQAPSPLPTVGQPVTQVGTTSAGCYNSDFLSDYLCYNVTPCATSCLRTTSICTGQDIVVSTSGENTAYEQVFVLTDMAGNFVAQNTTGVFSTATLSGTDYRVHAINYSPSNPPSPLPSSLPVGAPIASITGGCYNSDFLTDYVCFNISCLLHTPVLLSFNGEKDGVRNLLHWQVEVSPELSHFILERSADGYTAFAALGTVYATEAVGYRFWDELPLQKSYYRLRSVFNDGSIAYSNVIYLEREKGSLGDIRVYPNPTDGDINVDITAAEEGQLSLQLFNVLGQNLSSVELSLLEGNNRIALAMKDYAEGVYLLVMKQGAWQQTQRIVKQ